LAKSVETVHCGRDRSHPNCAQMYGLQLFKLSTTVGTAAIQIVQKRSDCSYPNCPLP